jgi:rare lipoprotein A
MAVTFFYGSGSSSSSGVFPALEHVGARSRRVVAPLFLIAGCTTCRAAPPLYPEGSSPPPPASAQAPAAAAQAPAPANEPSEQAAFRERFASAKVLATQLGEASYYSDALAGRSTASGEPYDPKRFTAAHRKLPFGTVLRVVRVDDGRSVYVKVNDRGPFGKRDRIIDLSRSAAEALGMIRAGVTQIRLEVVESSDASRLR